MKKKKIAATVVCCVLVVLIAAGAIVWSQLPHPLTYDIDSIESIGDSEVTVIEKTDDEVDIRLPSGRDIKILTFTDMHLDGKNETSSVTIKNLVRNIQAEKPDLVILGGDNVTSGLNGVRAKQLGMIFEKLGVYWAGVIGNHEGDNPWSVTRPAMMEIFTSFEHCLMRKGPDDIDGDCNYVLNIFSGDGDGKKLLRTFWFFDTFDEMSEEYRQQNNVPADAGKYDGVHENQIKWYEKKAAENRAEYGDAPATVVLHIPLPQYKTTVESGAKLLYGVNYDSICASGFDTGLFDAVKKDGAVDSVFCGHDHLNSFGVERDGILLSYMQPSGYGSYGAQKLGFEEKDWLQGYTKLTVKTDGSFEREGLRNSEIWGVSEAETAD